MATATVKNRCAICGKEKASFKCEGCSRTFCYNHVTDHRQELSKQFDEIEVIRDLFRQTLTEQTNEPRKHPLIQKIDTWERESINKIRQTADEARQLLLRQTTDHVAQIEVKLTKLTEQLRRNRQENDFVETDLNHWKDELTRLTKELAEPSNISLRQDTTSLVTNIFVDIPLLLGSTNIGINTRWMQNGVTIAGALICIPNIGINAKWIQNGVTVAGGNGQGNGRNQLYVPCGLYVDDDHQTIYVTEWLNHRVVEWKIGATSGLVVAGGNGQGNQTNQLNNPARVMVDKETDSLIICDFGNKRVLRWPRRNGTSGEIIISDIGCCGVAMDNYGYLYVSDYDKHEVKRWKMGDTTGTVVAGGNGTGNRLDQLTNPAFIFVDQDRSVYVSDDGNHRVTKWMQGAKGSIVVAGGQGAGNGLTQLNNPLGVVVDQLGTVYVVDCANHRVMRWLKGARQGSVVVGGNGVGGGSNQLSGPWGLAFDRQGNLYVSDWSNHRVQKFNIDPSTN